MPWILDENGEKAYKPSIYTKEELPTWSEMYEEFYKKEIYAYIEENDKDIDPYWNIPRNKVLLSQACNQLNKMLFEDGLRETLIKQFDLIDVRFLLCTEDGTLGNELIIGTDKISPIYTIPLPTKKPNPFIVGEETRINIADIEGDIYLAYVVVKDEDFDFYYGFEKIFQEAIENILHEMEEYFNGERPGWKDENGKLVGCSQCDRSCKTGFDPAL